MTDGYTSSERVYYPGVEISKQSVLPAAAGVPLSQRSWLSPFQQRRDCRLQGVLCSFLGTP